MTIQSTPVLRTMKQDNNTTWLILYEELHCIMAMVLLSHNNHLSEVLDHNLRSQIPITCLWPLMEPLDHWSIQTVEGVSHHLIHSSSVCSNERMNWPESYMEKLNGVLVIWGEHCNGCRCNCFVNCPIFQFL